MQSVPTAQPGQDQPPPPLEPELLLLDAVIALSAYRRELQRAGYPFREPPKVAATITAIEEYCTPPDMRTIRRRAEK